jgi:DNA end-binding protein Ku
VSASRPFWKGHLKLSLVTCPIALYPATSASEKVVFRQINRKTGHRLRQQLVDEETGEIVEAADKVRGYEVDKGVYLPIEDEELDAIAIESSHTIDIDRFAPRAHIDERYIDSPYYLTPHDKAGLEAFCVIRDAMADKSMVALARVVLSKREHVLMIEPWGKGLLGTTLRYPYEIRSDEDYFAGIPNVKIPKEMLTLAQHILDTKKGDFDPAQFRDRYEQAMIDLIDAKKAGMPPPKRKFVARIVGGTDLMGALRRSVAETKAKDRAKAANANRRAKAKAPAAAAAAPKGKKAAKRNPDQREARLPIAGGAPPKKSVRKPAKATGRRRAG